MRPYRSCTKTGAGLLACCLAGLLLAPGRGLSAPDSLTVARQEMVATIRREYQENTPLPGGKGPNERVLAALGRVERHRFVPPESVADGYRNMPLPIGHGQTISQPFIVAVMTDLLAVRAGDKILEVGTGSGYQAAILDSLGAEVYTMEIIGALAEEAATHLQAQRFSRTRVKTGDGYFGWPEQGPFDAIIVTAAAGHIPPPLIAQLKTPGRMVIPVGSAFMVQHLVLVEKKEDGTLATRQILPVRFVPLTGGH